MILLAIDTALENCSVALDIDGRVVVSEQTIGRGHAEILMPQIAALFAEARIEARDLSRIAVCVGPGSYTGLRVGISAARGLALVTRVTVIGVSTLHAHAHTVMAERRDGTSPILALLPARGDELYGQLFSPAGAPTGPPAVRTITDFAALAEAEDALTAGAGAALLGLAGRIVHARSAPDIGAILKLGALLDPAGHPPKPLYIKPPDAALPLRAGIARR